MELKLKVDFPIADFTSKIAHESKLVLLGSCFTNEMGNKFRHYGFEAKISAFGTIFHPIPLARLVSETLTGIQQERILQRNDLFFSWDASSSMYDLSVEMLIEKLNAERADLKSQLTQANVVFITFGTALGYEEMNQELIVANCHKMPKDHFYKSLTDYELLIDTWMNTLNDLFALNPSCEVVFTVSPVRHIKDGLVENNRSKSRLFELISALEAHPQVHYFPAYEIVMDELRDYRFYKVDGIHPNQQAIDYVWNRFSATFLNQVTQSICKEVNTLRRMESHETLFEGSREVTRFKTQRTEKISAFLAKNPSVRW